jgi:hypothetical protein
MPKATLHSPLLCIVSVLSLRDLWRHFFSLEAPRDPRLSSLVRLTERSLLQTLAYGPDVMQNIQRGPSPLLEACLAVDDLIGCEERWLVYCGLMQRQRGGLLLLSQLNRADIKDRRAIRSDLNAIVYLLRLEVRRLNDHAVALASLQRQRGFEVSIAVGDRFGV